MSSNPSQTPFKATWTSVTVRRGDAGNLIGDVNMEGHAEGFGPFIGTMSFTPAGSEHGTWSWASTCWLEEGGFLDIVGQGRADTDARLHFVANGYLVDNRGRQMQLESTIDLASKTWAGTVSAPA